MSKTEIKWRKYPEEKPYKDGVYNVTVNTPPFDVVESKLMAFRDGKFQNYGTDEEVIDDHPDVDIHWCSRTHQSYNIVDMVEFLGYERE